MYRGRVSPDSSAAGFTRAIGAIFKSREDEGDRAVATSAKKVDDTRTVLVEQLKKVVADLEARSDFYDKTWNSYDEALERVRYFKDYVENNDGYKLINRAGRPFSREDEVQLFFGLIWCRSEFDVNREPNDGRRPLTSK